MKVVYMSSNMYAMYTGVSIVSMLKHNSTDPKIEYVLLDDGLTDENREILLSIFQSYGVFCEVKDTKSCYQRAVSRVTKDLRVYNGARTGWLRLFPDELFPGYTGIVMYVDSDTVIGGSLCELHDLEWGNRILCACTILKPSIDGIIQSSTEEERIVKDRRGVYFNSGIVLYNMQNFLKQNGSEKINASIRRLSVFRYIEQTVLNDAFSVDEVLPLPAKFNYTYHLRPKYEKKQPNDEKQEVKEPVIIHFPGYNCRPWYRESTSNLAYKYREYQKLSPWKGVQESYYDSEHYKQLPLDERIKERIRIPFYNTPLYGLFLSTKRLIRSLIKKKNEE